MQAYTLGWSAKGNKVARLRQVGPDMLAPCTVSHCGLTAVLQGFFAGFDLPWMQRHWFDEATAPGHKCAPLLQH